ncbi:UNKNOWN [Stylonychia lemnae]|uniref:Cell division control protein 73 C-terminal domain-containing protein n=1 Tax=Stylonychia lemnae TaxID=5949 RepID=A0A078AN64_STYLE|nr:UNKNOWN [Stylonychia lemnae]|eukprot:CDW82797.1 UNKNOWN [Stylonychia lemnae]
MLRDSFNNKKEIVFSEGGNELIFTETGYKIPRDVQTAWLMKDRKGHYNIGAIWYYVSSKDMKMGEYVASSQKNGFQMIQLLDRKEVQDFFTGQIKHSDSIDESFRPQTLIKKSQLKGGKVVQLGEQIARKRDAKAEEKQQRKMEVYEHLLYNERKIASRATAIQCQNRSFLKVLQLAYQMTGQEQKVKEVKDRIEKRQGKCQVINLDLGSLNDKIKRKRSLLEEITKLSKVPGSFYQGNICLGNAIKFLQEGQYVANISSVTPTANGLSQDDKHAKIEVQRKIGSDQVSFEIVDNVQAFDNSQWSRVVAVFTNGQDWQFKDWPTKKMVELFLRVRGYYIHYQDQTTLPELTTKYNIKILTLQRNKRHQDGIIHNEFWHDLETFLKKERFQGLNF